METVLTGLRIGTGRSQRETARTVIAGIRREALHLRALHSARLNDGSGTRQRTGSGQPDAAQDDGKRDWRFVLAF